MVPGEVLMAVNIVALLENKADGQGVSEELEKALDAWMAPGRPQAMGWAIAHASESSLACLCMLAADQRVPIDPEWIPALRERLVLLEIILERSTPDVSQMMARPRLEGVIEQFEALVKAQALDQSLPDVRSPSLKPSIAPW